MKSGYWLVDTTMAKESSFDSDIVHNWWRKFWTLSIPSKVKICYWHIYQDALLIVIKLFHRKVIQSPSCSPCGSAWESITRALIT